ncbi:MAG: ZapG family protein [Pseudomonadota bacterium]|jgi:uncharacterized protein
MPPTELLLIIGALLVGLAAGAALGRALARRADARLRLSDQLRSRDQRLQLYEREVREHFERTAQLSEELDRTLEQLRQHLARGAGKLAGEELGRRIAGSAPQQPLEPPRDYAPSSGLLRGDPPTAERTGPERARPLQLVGEDDDPTFKVG